MLGDFLGSGGLWDFFLAPRGLQLLQIFMRFSRFNGNLQGFCMDFLEAYVEFSILIGIYKVLGGISESLCGLCGIDCPP